MRVMFAVYGAKTHFYNMVPLAWALRAAGHEVCVATQPEILDAVARTGLPVAAVGDETVEVEPAEAAARARTGQSTKAAHIGRVVGVSVRGGPGCGRSATLRLDYAAPRRRLVAVARPAGGRMPRIDRPTAMIGLVLAGGGSMAVLLFWIMAAISRHRGYGLIAQLELTGAWEVLFWAYPFLLFLTLFGGIVAFFAKAHEASVAIAGLPIVAIVLYYFAMVRFY